jgi:hypothetical protein
MLKRTPLIAIVIAVILCAAVKYIFELPERPFTILQLILLYILSYSVALGIAMYFDPKVKDTTKKFMGINFYEEK